MAVVVSLTVMVAAGPGEDVSQPAELDWVRQARAGDREAFAALVDLYWDCLRRWLFGLTQNRHLAEDLTQEAFVKAWLSLGELRGEGRFRAWLFRIARNLVVDSRRGPRGSVPRPLPEELAGSEQGGLADLMDAEVQRALQAACARLPLACRAAYLLWTQEELPYDEIARALAISPEAARWRVCKARKILLKELRTYLERPQP
jgi:RNA polymerase sigma-70 factor (ECF subfamily)